MTLAEGHLLSECHSQGCFLIQPARGVGLKSARNSFRYQQKQAVGQKASDIHKKHRLGELTFSRQQQIMIKKIVQQTK